MNKDKIISVASQAAADHISEVIKSVNGLPATPEKNVYAAVFAQLCTAAGIEEREVERRIAANSPNDIPPRTAYALGRNLIQESKNDQMSLKTFKLLIQHVFPAESPIYVDTAKKNMDDALAAYTGKPKS